METRVSNPSDRSMVAGFSNFMWTDLYPVFASLSVAGYIVYQVFAAS
jgi:hypothetical protein